MFNTLNLKVATSVQYCIIITAGMAYKFHLCSLYIMACKSCCSVKMVSSKFSLHGRVEAGRQRCPEGQKNQEGHGGLFLFGSSTTGSIVMKNSLGEELDYHVQVKSQYRKTGKEKDHRKKKREFTDTQISLRHKNHQRKTFKPNFWIMKIRFDGNGGNWMKL